MPNERHTTNRQIGTIYDLIAAGEIDGLVGTGSGVYLNDTPILPLDKNKVYSANSSKTAAIATSNGVTTITHASMFKDVDLSYGDRYVAIKGFGPSVPS